MALGTGRAPASAWRERGPSDSEHVLHLTKLTSARGYGRCRAVSSGPEKARECPTEAATRDSYEGYLRAWDLREGWVGEKYDGQAEKRLKDIALVEGRPWGRSGIGTKPLFLPYHRKEVQPRGVGVPIWRIEVVEMEGVAQKQSATEKHPIYVTGIGSARARTRKRPRRWRTLLRVRG